MIGYALPKNKVQRTAPFTFAMLTPEEPINERECFKCNRFIAPTTKDLEVHQKRGCRPLKARKPQR